MKKRIEIEAKFELLNVKELLKILERLEKDNNAKLVEKDEMQKDTYFTPNDRNFLDKRPVAEWLRTREENGKYSITYKNWAKEDGENAKFKCREVEINVDDIEAIREIFDVLKAKELVVVEKTRTSYLYKDIIISIDIVEKLRKFCRIRI
jgi:putative adenylyl cyclase cyaB